MRSIVDRGTLARLAQNTVRWEFRAAIPAPARGGQLAECSANLLQNTTTLLNLEFL